MAGYFPPDMPRYPDVTELPVGPKTRVGGSQVRMSLFSTTDEPAKVAAFYARFWRSRRLWVRNDVTHVGGVVSAVDERSGRILQLMIIVKGGRTVAFPSITRAPLAARQTERTAPPVPLIEDSRVLFALTTADAGAKAHIVLSINDAGMAANLQHYRQVLIAAGYRPERRRTDNTAASSPDKRKKRDKRGRLTPGEHRILLHRNQQGQEITVNLTAIGGDRVRVHIMAVGS